jgi:hypothetical protein
MSKFKVIHSSTSAVLMALTFGIAGLFPNLSLAPAAAQRLFQNSPSSSFSRRVVIPTGTRIPVRSTEEKKILVMPDETMPLTLEVAANFKDRQGNIFIPAGSQIVGEIRPVKTQGGSQFVAEKIILQESPQFFRERPLQATSAVVTHKETIEKGANTGNILIGAAAGAGAAAAISAIVGGNVPWQAVLGGAGVGALGGWLLGKDRVDVISINPNEDLTLTLNSEFYP